MKKCFGKQIENIDFGNAQTTHCRQNVFDQTKQSLKQSTQQPRKIVNDNETKHYQDFINNQVNSKYTSLDQQHCSIHYSKHASHYFYSKYTTYIFYYCYKCAIMLASQGFNIHKLRKSLLDHVQNSINECSDRQREINEFLQYLSVLIVEVNDRNTMVMEQLRSSESHYNELIKQVSGFYSQLYEVIEVQKYLSYNSILTHRAHNYYELRTLRSYLIAGHYSLYNISNDVQNNLKTVYTVQDDVYQSIMGNYFQKLDRLAEIVDISVQKVPRVYVKLPYIPSNLCSLADRISIVNDKLIVEHRSNNLNFESHRNSQRNVESLGNIVKYNESYFHVAKEVEKPRNSIKTSSMYKIKNNQLWTTDPSPHVRSQRKYLCDPSFLYKYTKLKELITHKTTSKRNNRSLVQNRVYDQYVAFSFESNKLNMRPCSYYNEFDTSSNLIEEIPHRKSSAMYSKEEHEYLERDSLNLTEIKYLDLINQSRQAEGRIMLSSQYSIGIYLNTDTLRNSECDRNYFHEETDTLLLV